ncbi:MAG TPA: DUF1702 family protein [Phycisphaerae bacterium]|nr:DUF1702 family protein [Phycisphaerae bacterium]
MSRVISTLRTRLFGISRRETTFARRGFPPCGEAQRRHLERIGENFVRGYQAALTWDVTPVLVDALESVESEFRGFAYEGAAMARALLDALTPWRRDRMECFLAGAGDAHVYMIHVGVGFALARLKKRVEPTMRELHPLYRWLVVDGYGFHEGFFRWRESFEQQRVPDRITGYARRVFDQGLGRALWFVGGADARSITERIGAFSRERRADLWSGIGLASAYAGGMERADLEALRAAAGDRLPQLLQGAAFAAKARQRAGNLTPHTELACRIFANRSAEEAAGLTDEALAALPSNGSGESYETWRQRVAASLIDEKTSVANKNGDLRLTNKC